MRARQASATGYNGKTIDGGLLEKQQPPPGHAGKELRDRRRSQLHVDRERHSLPPADHRRAQEQIPVPAGWVSLRRGDDDAVRSFLGGLRAAHVDAHQH